MNLKPLEELTPEEQARLDEQDRAGNGRITIEQCAECERLRAEVAKWKDKLFSCEAELGNAHEQLEELQGDYSYLEAGNKMNMEEGEKLHKQLVKAKDLIRELLGPDPHVKEGCDCADCQFYHRAHLILTEDLG